MVTWTNMTDGHSASGTTLIKDSSSNNWTADATSSTTWTAATQTADVEFTVSHSSMDYFCGFDLIANLDSYNMDYAMYLGGSGDINIYENGSQVSGGVSTYTNSDTLKVSMASDGTVTYYKNDSLIYTSSTTASGEYRVNAVVYSAGRTLTATLTTSGSGGGSGGEESTPIEGESSLIEHILYLNTVVPK